MRLVASNRMSVHDSDSYDSDEDIYDLLNSGAPLTVETVTRILDEIRSLDDFEPMHSYEDKLMATFVKQVAEGVLTDLDTIQAIAKIIKQVNGLKFARYCA